MSDIHIHRPHTLGLARAREVAAQWADEAETKFGMACRRTEGKDGDTLEFKRRGAGGTLAVAADHFAVDIQLGFLMSAFKPVIQAEIEKNLDALLAESAPKAKSPLARKPGSTRT